MQMQQPQPPNDEENNERGRGPWRTMAILATLLMIVSFFRVRAEQNSGGHQSSWSATHHISPFPWDRRSIQEDGEPMEILFLGKENQTMINYKNQTYIGTYNETAMPYVTTCGQNCFLTIKNVEKINPQKDESERDCYHFLDAEGPHGPWTELKNSNICPKQITSPPRPIGGLLINFPRGAFWTTEYNDQHYTCIVSLVKETQTEPAVKVLEGDWNYCMIDDFMRSIICFQYYVDHLSILVLDSTTDEMKQKWSTAIPISPPNFMFLRSPITQGYILLTQLASTSTRPKAIVLDVRDGSTFLEEFSGLLHEKVRQPLGKMKELQLIEEKRTAGWNDEKRLLQTQIDDLHMPLSRSQISDESTFSNIVHLMKEHFSASMNDDQNLNNLSSFIENSQILHEDEMGTKENKRVLLDKNICV